MRSGVLSAAAITAGAAGLPLAAAAPQKKGGTGYKTRRVIVVAFSGGVRSQEVLGTPQNVPNLTRIAKSGIVFPNVRTANLGHYGAALSIFTGNTEAMSIRDAQRGLNPTIFEYLRKECGFSNTDAWLSTTNGAQGRLFAHSDHPDYGAKYGANVLDSDGIFNKEFKDVLESFGKPAVDDPKTSAIMDRLAGAIDPKMLGAVEGARPDPAQIRRIEGFILDELRGRNTRLTGPGAGDAKAIRVGHSILGAFKPKLLVITLQNADIAHSSYNAYVEVIRRNDAELGKLWDAVQQDPELKDSTSILICPEFGRDRNLNQRNGLDHGDASDSMRKVFLIAAGPDFKSNAVGSREISTLQVCPTVMALFTRKKPQLASVGAIRAAFA